MIFNAMMIFLLCLILLCLIITIFSIEDKKKDK